MVHSDFVHQNYLYSFGGYVVFSIQQQFNSLLSVQILGKLFYPILLLMLHNQRNYDCWSFDSNTYVGPALGKKYIKAEQKILDQIYKDLWVLDIDEMGGKNLFFHNQLKNSLIEILISLISVNFQCLTAKDLVLFNYKTEQFEIYADYKSTLFKEALAIEENDEKLFVFD